MNKIIKDSAKALLRLQKFNILQQMQTVKDSAKALRILQELNRLHLLQTVTLRTVEKKSENPLSLDDSENLTILDDSENLSLDDIELTILDDSENLSLDDIENLIIFVLTSHPTNLGFDLKDENGNPRKPTIYEEIKHYHTLLATNPVPENTEIWFGYDMDRHPEESPNVFPYAFLQNMRSSLLRNGLALEGSEIIQKCDAISDKLEKAGNANQVIDVKQELQILAKDVQSIQATDAAKFGFKAHYRISADDLKSDEGKSDEGKSDEGKSGKGIKKISTRLTELRSLQEIFGIMPVSQIIIADCNKPEHIQKMHELLNEVMPNSTINITPLVEENLSDDILSAIIAKADKTVMLAGSDSIQRDTYVGASIMKMKIQQLIRKHNLAYPDNIKTFFEGAGSTINRNGRILPSRMGTILEGGYRRTLQGQEAQQYIENYNGHQDTTLNEANNSPRCTIEDINAALPLFEKIYNDISKKQIALQADPKYTNIFDRDKIFELVNNNAHYGSRSKKPTSPETLNIKEQRAITQSMIHNTMGFQPEMMYWNTISDDMKDQIKANMSNSLIKDFLNQYALLWQGCDLEASKQWIKDDTLYNSFVQSYKAFQNFMGEIKAMPNRQEDLALNNLNNHSPRFGYEVYDNPPIYNSTGAISKDPIQKSIHHITGSGFCTQQRPTFLAVLLAMEKERAEGEKERDVRMF